KDGSLKLNDNSNAEAGTITLEPINVSVKNIHWPSDNAMEVALALGFASGGELVIDAEGTLEPTAFTGNITLSEFLLEPLNPWLREQMPLQLDSGTAFIEQAFDMALDGEENLSLTAKGRAQIDDLSLREIDKRTIASWQSVAVEDTDFT